jgi:hypothetical protein
VFAQQQYHHPTSPIAAVLRFFGMAVATETLIRHDLSYQVSDRVIIPPRGRRGAHRVDDRRAMGGVLHMLRVGGPLA